MNMAGPTQKFTVTGIAEFEAYIYRDQREQWNRIVVGFSPHLSPLPHYPQHEVGESTIRRRAREVALELASKLSGLPIDELETALDEGVGAITVVPKNGTYPSVDS